MDYSESLKALKVFHEDIDDAKPHDTKCISHESRVRNLQRALNLPQNVNRPIAHSSLHSEAKDGLEEEEEEGLAGWLQGHTNICSPQNKCGP